MRRAPRLDSNHHEVAEALRKCGCTVFSLAGQANGCPDLLVSIRGHVFLVEVKSEDGALTEDQRRFVATWQATVWVVRSAEGARAVVSQVLGGGAVEAEQRGSK